MFLCRLAQVVRRHVQVDLRTGDHAVTQQIADRDEIDAFTHEMRGEGVPEAMRRERLRQSRAAT